MASTAPNFRPMASRFGGRQTGSHMFGSLKGDMFFNFRPRSLFVLVRCARNPAD